MNLHARWAVLAAPSLVFLTGYTGCDNQPTLTYHPVYLPIEISLEPNGDIVLSAAPEMATPIGTFSATEPLAKYKTSGHTTLLAVRRSVHGTLEEDLIRVNSTAPMKFLLDGHYSFSSQGNAAILNLHAGVTGIRIEKLRAAPSTGKFSAQQVPALPTPTAAPTVTPPAHIRSSGFDNGSPIGNGNPLNTTLTTGRHLITTTATDADGNSTTSAAVSVAIDSGGAISATASCGTVNSDGTVTCTATATGGTGDFAFRWDDNGSPIGTGNPLTVTLPPAITRSLSRQRTATAYLAPPPAPPSAFPPQTDPSHERCTADELSRS